MPETIVVIIIISIVFYVHCFFVIIPFDAVILKLLGFFATPLGVFRSIIDLKK